MNKDLLQKFQTVVNSLEQSSFTSHDFVKKFLAMYEEDYKSLFSSKTLQATHSQIGKMLSDNAEKLGISKEAKTLSENFHGKVTTVQGWLKLLCVLFAFCLVPKFGLAQTSSMISNPEENEEMMVKLHSYLRKDNFNPYSLTAKTKVTVIDTLMAKFKFSQIVSNCDAKKEKLSKLTKVLGTKGKIKDQTELSLLGEVYLWAKNNSTKLVQDEMSGKNKVSEKLKQGKLTSEIKEYIERYRNALSDSVKYQQMKIERGWFFNVNPLPEKEIMQDALNPYYIGFNYNDGDLLDFFEREGQEATWKHLFSRNYQKKEDVYPSKFEYLQYAGYPQYKVAYYEEEVSPHNIYPRFVYDNNGNLVYVAPLKREEFGQPFDEIRRLVYLRDYQNDKYGIKSKGEKTQLFLQRMLCRNEGLTKTQGEALASAFVAAFTYGLRTKGATGKKISDKALGNVNVYRDTDGENYMAQLIRDHKPEFEVIYMIERLSNVSFRIVYLDEELKPSHCAILTYKTGDKPFSVELEGRLVEMPNSVPPVVKCSGMLCHKLESMNVFDYKSKVKAGAGDSLEELKAQGHKVVEPQFPGGVSALMAYLNKNVKYPVVAWENGVQGRVIVSFVVDEDGAILDPKVARSVDPSLDREAIRVVRKMPKWIPGMLDGKPFPVKFSVPVVFGLK